MSGIYQGKFSTPDLRVDTNISLASSLKLSAEVQGMFSPIATDASKISSGAFLDIPSIYTKEALNDATDRGAAWDDKSYAGKVPTVDLYNYFLSNGFTPAQAAGILGNIHTESRFSTSAYNPSENAIGLCQWEGGRKTNLENFAKQKHMSIYDWHLQADFIMEELKTSESNAYDQLMKATTPEEAAQVFQSQYERSKYLGDRPQNARYYFDQLSASASAPALDSTQSIEQLLMSGMFHPSLNALLQTGLELGKDALVKLFNGTDFDASKLLNFLPVHPLDEVANLELQNQPKIILREKGFDPTDQQQPADFIINKDGTIFCNHIPEVGQKEIIIEDVRSEGDFLSGASPEQKGAAAALVAYLQQRLAMTDSTGVHIPEVQDPEGLLPEPLPDASASNNSSDSNGTGNPGENGSGGYGGSGGGSDSGYPGSGTQSQTLNRLDDAGDGQITQNQASALFAHPDNEPSIPGESNQMLALKDVTGSLETKSFPGDAYAAVLERGDDGYGVGRFGFTAYAYLGWLDGFSDADFDDLEDMEDPLPASKDHKTAPGKLPHGTVKRLRAIKKKFDAFKDKVIKDGHGPGGENTSQMTDKDLMKLFLNAEAKTALPPNATDEDKLDQAFIQSLSQLANKGDKPDSDELTQFYPPELQEIMANQLVNKYAYQSAQLHDGKFQPSDVVLAMHLGYFPSEKDIAKFADSIVHPADLGYPLAYKARENPNAPFAWSELGGTPVGDPESYFITQFRSKYNPDVSGAQELHNADCGPTSLAMLLVHYGRVQMPDNRESLIETVESQFMGANIHNSNGYNLQQLKKGAEAANLHADRINGLAAVDKAFEDNPNASVILVGQPRHAWQDDPRQTSETYVDSGSCNHIVVIAGKTSNGDYILLDPLSLSGPRIVTRQQIQRYIADGLNGEGGTGLVVYP